MRDTIDGFSRGCLFPGGSRLQKDVIRQLGKKSVNKYSCVSDRPKSGPESHSLESLLSGRPGNARCNRLENKGKFTRVGMIGR